MTDARTLNAWRRWGYRLLPGDVYSYVLHLRPAEWPIMAGHTLLGYVLAVGVQGAVRGEHWVAALRALVIWVLFLNGGTLAINSVFDRDEGDIGYLNAPPQLPPYLLHFSLALLIGGQLLALMLPLGFQIAYAICFVMSVLYSVPPFRKSTQIMRGKTASCHHAPRPTPCQPTASTYPNAVCAAMIGHSAGRRCKM